MEIRPFPYTFNLAVLYRFNVVGNTYTPDGKLETREWARGTTTTYAYDGCCGSLTNITYSDSTPSVTYTYDRLGRQQGITDAQGIRAFTYNDLLQLTHETTVANGETNTITRNYNTLGRSSGVALNDDYAVTYGFDNLGRFHSVSSSVHSAGTEPVESVFEYSYLQNSSLIAGYTSQNGFEVTKSYEPNRNLLTEVKNQFDNTTISQYNYTNDEIGRRTKRIDTMINTTTNTFGYNNKSELIAAALGLDDYGYNYDQIGNRITATSSVDSVTSETDYLSNALNQYTNVSYGQGSSLPTYDADGNMTYLPSTSGGGAGGEGWFLHWNGENRLIAASNATTIVNFKYDYMGRRFEKSVDGGETTTFVYNDWAMIHETSSTATNNYVYGLDLSGSMQGAGTIGGILSASLNDMTAFYCYDANGNVTDLVGTNGITVAHYEYDPFGQTTVADDSDGSGIVDLNPFRWSTKHTDDETGLVMYEYRAYSPELGRFVRRDPLGSGEYRGFLEIRATQLPYVFVENSPIGNIDPHGLWCTTMGTICNPLWSNKWAVKRREYTDWTYGGYGDPGGMPGAPPVTGVFSCMLALAVECCRYIPCVCEREERVYGDKWQERTCSTLYICSTPPMVRDRRWTQTKNSQTDVLLGRPKLENTNGYIKVTLADSDPTKESKCRKYCSSLNTP